MRGSSRSEARKSSPKRSEGCFYRYLKPGALAKLRDSKITARSRRHASQTLISLSKLLPPTSPSSSTEHSSPDPPNQINVGVPCFALRINSNRPRCLQRKKLFAVTPIFTETEQF